MKHILSILSLALAAVLPAAAQSHVDKQREAVAANTVMFEIGGTKYTPEQVDSINRIIAQYYYDQFRSFQDPEAPYFLFLSKDSQLAMGIGGVVRMRGWYDIGNVVPANGFAPYLIPMGDGRVNDKRLGSTPAGTALYFRVLGRNKMLGHYQLYIEGNFNGYKGVGFQLKKAYAVVGDFTIGYAASTFGDPAAQSPVIDAQGANNKISNTAVLLRYMRTVAPGFTVAASVETPSPQIGADGTNTGNIDNICPDGAAFLQYAWSPTSHVRLSGTVRSLGYRDLLTGRNHRKAGWGLLLSGTGHPAEPLTVYATLNYGRGYASLGGDLLCGNYDLIDNSDAPGTMYAPAALGYQLGLQYNFRPNLFVSAAFSQSRLYVDHPVAGTEYKYGLWACGNLFWNLTPRIQAGVEFDWGLRCNFDGHARSSRRIGAMCQFSF
ncbi:MAG: hypothetical protein K2L99_08415 [Muribaculaceae bacterium]|nr:hypothetical protein [Muribaculaceae bacterium]